MNLDLFFNLNLFSINSIYKINSYNIFTYLLFSFYHYLIRQYRAIFNKQFFFLSA